MDTRRVVITGMGALTPIGNNLKEYWENLIAGKSGAAPITKFDSELFKTKFACELKNFDPLNYFDKKELRRYDPFVLYGLIASQEAISDANIDLGKINAHRSGVIWSSGNGGVTTFEKEVTEFALGNGVPRYSPFFIPRILSDTASGMISIKFGLKGISYCTVSACASSTSGIIDAFNYIKWGQADLMVAGGSEAPITKSIMGGFNALKALSTRNDEPTTACRPFDVERDGFVMGEGAGALILESYESAKARGAKIYAEIIGGGMSSDAYHMTATHPEGEGAFYGMANALREAQVGPEEVDYVNAHATSTPLGDESEMKAVSKLFCESLDKLNVSSTKSVTGHLLGGAGAIEAIATTMAIKNNIIPPTINTKDVDPNVPEGIDLTLGKMVKKEVKMGLSNTFGFGGHNASVLIKEFID